MNSQQHPTAGRRLIPASEFRRILGGISEMSRWRLVRDRIGPRPLKVGRNNYYFEDEILAYLDQLAASRPDADAAGEGEAEEVAERTAAQ